MTNQDESLYVATNGKRYVAVECAIGKCTTPNKAICALIGGHCPDVTSYAPSCRHDERKDGKAIIWKLIDPAPTAAVLAECLREVLAHYVRLAESGDAGFWDVDNEEIVKKARELLGRVEPTNKEN